MRPFQTTKYGLSLLLLLLITVCPSIAAAATSDWEQLYPGYPTHGFNDIYVAGASSAFAVGNFGLIYRYNGTTWSTMTSPVSANLNAVWGRSASDVFAVGDNGTILHYNGVSWQAMSSPTSNNLHSVWGFSAAGSPVYAGGRDGDILKYAGGTWSFMETPLADGIWDAVYIYGIWGYSADNLYAVGYREGDTNEDIFLHCTDGSNWSEITNFPGIDFRPTAIWGIAGGLMYIGGGDGVYSLTDGAGTWNLVLADSNGIGGIWGASASNIWAVGDSIYHFNGSIWDPIIADVDPQNLWGGLGAVFGSSAANVFAAGDAGRIWRYQGSAWSSMTTVPEYPVRDIWNDGPDSLCAVGDNGLVIQSDGASWKPMASATNEDLRAVCGWGNGHYLAAGVGGTVQYYNGATWSTVSTGTTQILNDVWCNAPDSAFVVGTGGTIRVCIGPVCTDDNSSGPTTDLYAVLNSSLDTFAAGENGALLRKAGPNSWTTLTPCPDSIRITDLWRGTAIEAVGYYPGSGEGYLYSYDTASAAWSKRFGPLPSSYLQKAAGNTFAELALVGYGGSFPYAGLVVDNTGATVKTLAGYHLYAASRSVPAGDLYLGGAQQDQNSPWHGQILKYDGSAWTNMIETNPLNDIWGSGLDSVFAVGDNGTVLHYDGASVQAMESNTVQDLSAVFASDNATWASATGWLGEMLYFDGSTWATGTSPATDALNDLWGQGDTVFGVGSSGTILRSGDRGMSWETMASPTSQSLNAVWGTAADGPIFAAGDSGTVLRYTGSGWAQMTTNTSSSAMSFHGIWGSSGQDVYVVGETYPFLGSNESQIIHYDGGSWKQSYYSYNTWPPKYLTGIWGRSAKDVIAFGRPNLRKQCGRGWGETSTAGIPPLEKGWGAADPDGNYHIFGITAYDSIYHSTIPASEVCSSTWTLFMPAILAPKK